MQCQKTISLSTARNTASRPRYKETGVSYPLVVVRQVERFQMHHEKCQHVRGRGLGGWTPPILEIWLDESSEWLLAWESERKKERKKERTVEVLSVGDRIRLFVYTADHRRDSPIVPRGTASLFHPPGVRYRPNNDLSSQIGRSDSEPSKTWLIARLLSRECICLANPPVVI